MTPLFNAGPLYVTPYSLMILLGVLAGVGLSLRKQQVRPLLPAVLLGALVFGHLVWVLFCPYDYEAPEGKLHMILRPWEGGYTLYGALLGGAVGALLFGRVYGVKWRESLDALTPGACAAIFFARIGEAFTGDIPTFLKTDADRAAEDSLLSRWVASLPEPHAREMAALYAEMEVRQSLEARIYKALDGLEALIQHNESDLSTWSENEYELNLHYCDDRVGFSPALRALREAIREDTIARIAEADKEQGEKLC